jgi:Spy/CpxP family protein refolding chaperone
MTLRGPKSKRKPVIQITMNIRTALVIAVALTGAAQLAAQPMLPSEGRPHPGVFEKMPEEVKALVQQFQQERLALLEDRRTLAEALRNATEEERRLLISQFHESNRERVELQRQLRNQIREQMRQLRDEHRRGGQG